MLFSEVIGHEEVKQHLTEMVQHNRLSHALLFLGKEGNGCLPLALAFAQYVVSLPASKEKVMAADLFGGFSAMESAEPATDTVLLPDQIAELPAYLRATQLIHPDLHFSYPVVTKKPGDKLSPLA